MLRSVENKTLPEPQLTLYGASPFVEAKGRGTLTVRRLDVPGGLYAASFKSSQIVFRVDAQAKPGATPIVGRLLRME